MVDSRILFSGKEETYDNNRPRYPEELITYLYEEVGFCNSSVIADIGSGTGIFSKQLADKGSKVVCVEPNSDMMSVAKLKLLNYGNVSFIDGDCANTKLADSSVDFITVAQAFHWFNTEEFRKESKRILKSNGKSVLIWNRRDENDELNREAAEIIKKYCPRFNGFGGGMRDNNAIERYFGNICQLFECDNNIIYDRSGFIGRNLSGSYALRKGESGYEPFIRELGELFDRFSTNGVVIMANKTIAYWNNIE